MGNPVRARRSVCFAVAAALQQHEAARSPESARPGACLLLHLLRRPLWLAGLAATGGGAALHVVALRLGPLAIVQPIGVTGLIFALPLGAALHGRRVHRRELLAASLVGFGLIALLSSIQVQASQPSLSEPSTALLATITLVASAIAASVATRLAGAPRAAVLALGAGVAFGVTTALVRVVAHRAGVVGAEHAVPGWVSVAVVASAFTGLALSQAAYKAGSLAAVLPVLTIVDPLVAIGLGELLLGEPVLFTAAGAVVAAVSGLFVAAGTVDLARAVPGTSQQPASQPPGPDDAHRHCRQEKMRCAS